MSLLAICENHAANFAEIFANGDIHKIEAVIKQSIRQTNQCSTNETFCTNDGNNDFFILSSGLSNIEVQGKQKIDQFNHCIGTAGDAVAGPGGCLSGGQNGFFIIVSGNGSILANVEQLILEQNICREGVALCLNPLSNQVTLREQDQGSINAKALQKIDVKSECSGFKSRCITGSVNSFGGANHYDILVMELGDVNSISQQEVVQKSKCNGKFSKCDISGENRFDIISRHTTHVHTDTKQTVAQEAVCVGSVSKCLIIGQNLFDMEARHRANVETKSKQELDQQIVCAKVECNTRGLNGITIFARDRGNHETEVKQVLHQQIQCDGSNENHCDTNGSNNFDLLVLADPHTRNITNIETQTKQNLEQSSKCAASNDLMTCQNVGNNRAFIFVIEKATVKGKMNQLLSQINNCKDEATCLNGNFLPNGNQIIIAAIDGGEIKLVTGQTLKQKNACTGNSSCTNDGLNLIEIGPEGSVSGNVSVRAGIAQDISETNECESSFCSTTASNSAVIGSTSTSSFVRQSNVVKNVVESEDNKPARVVQSSDQNNQCSGGASCTSTASNSINTGRQLRPRAK